MMTRWLIQFTLLMMMTMMTTDVRAGMYNMNLFTNVKTMKKIHLKYVLCVKVIYIMWLQNDTFLSKYHMCAIIRNLFGTELYKRTAQQDCDEFSGGQTQGWQTDTHGQIHRQMQAMTIAEGQDWPRVIIMVRYIKWWFNMSKMKPNARAGKQKIHSTFYTSLMPFTKICSNRWIGPNWYFHWKRFSVMK